MDTQVEGHGSEEMRSSDQNLGENSGVNDKINLSVSHDSIAKSLRPLSKNGLAERIWVLGPNGEPKKLKERSLKEITNRLEVQPRISKVGRSGLRQVVEKLHKIGDDRVGLIDSGGPRQFESPPPPRSLHH